MTEALTGRELAGQRHPEPPPCPPEFEGNLSRDATLPSPAGGGLLAAAEGDFWLAYAIAASTVRLLPSASSRANSSSPNCACTRPADRSYSSRSNGGIGAPISSRSLCEAPKMI